MKPIRRSKRLSSLYSQYDVARIEQGILGALTIPNEKRKSHKKVENIFSKSDYHLRSRIVGHEWVNFGKKMDTYFGKK
jgi:hypothetical protein